MKVLVTGANGFVGQHISQMLEELGHEVYALVRNPKKLQANFPVERIIQLDLKLASLEDIHQKIPQGLDCVIHTAGIVHSFERTDFFEINSLATQKLYQALDEKTHFIFLSSLAASGPSQKDKDLTENDQLNPVSDYGRSKLQAEQALIQMKKNSPLSNAQLSILRPPMVVGPGDQGVLEIIKMIQSGLVITTGKGGLKKRYSFISVFDLARACIELMQTPPKKTQVFFCAHPDVIELKQLVGHVQKELVVKKVRRLHIPQSILWPLAKILGLSHKIRAHSLRLTPDKLNELIPESWTCSGQKLSESTGFEYRDSLEKILPQTLKDYRQRGWL